MAYALRVDDVDGLVKRHEVRESLNLALAVPLFTDRLRDEWGNLPGQREAAEKMAALAGPPAKLRTPPEGGDAS